MGENFASIYAHIKKYGVFEKRKNREQGIKSSPTVDFKHTINNNSN